MPFGPFDRTSLDSRCVFVEKFEVPSRERVCLQFGLRKLEIPRWPPCPSRIEHRTALDPLASGEAFLPQAPKLFGLGEKLDVKVQDKLLWSRSSLQLEEPQMRSGP